jgi:D-3-phosphoglycerate dehydrogenase / 2-oxoglutarate reductase
MKKVKIDCPVNFLSGAELSDLLTKHQMVLDTKDPDCLIVNPGTEYYLDSSYFAPYPNLKVVATPSTGVNHIDTNYLSERGIVTFCLLDNKESLEHIHASAEFTWIHIMNAFRKFVPAINYVDDWREDANEKRLRSNELAEKSIGIIGLGRIGRKVARYASAFSMNVFYYDPYVQNDTYKKVDNLADLKHCDAISINPYLTEETQGMITFGVFDGFKKDLVVVNSSRGEVVDEDYIYDLITSEKIIYSCDVLQNEQKIEDLRKSRLFNLKSDRLTITPHVAGATVESQVKALTTVLKLCQDTLLGK